MSLHVWIVLGLCMPQAFSERTTLCVNNTVLSDIDPFSDNSFKMAMEPLFEMTDNWLEIVQPENKGSLFEALDMADQLEEEGEVTFDNDDIRKVAKFYMGYAVLIVFSLLFIVAMPIAGIVYCCCLCCGKCGGRRGKRQPKSRDRCCRIVCGLILLVLNTCMLAAVICVYFTNEQLRRQTTVEPEALLPTLSHNMLRLDAYKEQLYCDLDVYVLDSLESSLSELQTTVNGLPASVQSKVSAQLNVTSTLDAAFAMADTADSIYSGLNHTNEHSRQLQTLQTALSAELGAVKTDLLTTLNAGGCAGPCVTVMANVSGLSSVAQYSNLPNLTTEMNAMAAVTASLRTRIQEGENNLDAISTKVQDSIQQLPQDFNVEVQNTTAQLRASLLSLTSQLDDVLEFSDWSDKLSDAEDDVETYGNYRYYAGIAIASLLLVVVLLLFVGLLCGFCCSSRNHNGASNGSDFLCVGTVCMFLLSSVLMVICVIVFVLGGLLHTEVCRNLVSEDGLEHSQAVQSMDEVLHSWLNRNRTERDALDLSLERVLSDCKENTPIFAVADLDKLYNVTEVIVNITDSALTAVVRAIGEVSLDNIGLIDLYTDDMVTSLDALKNAGLDDIDFDAFKNVLSVPLTSPELIELANELQGYSDTLPSGTRKEQLNTHIGILRGIAAITVIQINDQIKALRLELANLEQLIQGSGGGSSFEAQVTDLQGDLQQAEDDISSVDSTVQTTLTAAANAVIDTITETVRVLLDALRSDVGKCEPLYTALDSTVTEVCVDTIEPWNGFWFSLGWCLCFFIPCIVCSAVLLSLLRTDLRTDSYRHDGYHSNKPFEDPNYDAYQGHADDIPLAHQEQGYRYNAGYAADDYTASRATNYNPDSYPNSYPNAPPPHYGKDRTSSNRFQY